MIKKDLVNKKVVRAIALGLSAVMLTTPMTALAAPVGQSDDEVDEYNSTKCDAAEKEAADVQGAISNSDANTADAVDTANTVKNDVSTNVEAGEAGFVAKKDGEEPVDLAGAVINAANNVDDGDDESDNLVKANTEIEKVKKDLANAETADETAHDYADDAEDAADTATGVVDALDSYLESVDKTTDEQMDTINNATSVQEANDAYSNMNQTVDAAEKQFADSVEAYKKARDEYDSALAEVQKAEQAYQDALGKAEEDATVAEAALAAAKSNAEALKTAVNEAQKAVATTPGMTILDMEKKYHDADGNAVSVNFSGEEDKLFYEIMMSYYLPEVAKFDVSKITKSYWTKEGQHHKDHNHNYYTFEYKDESGQTQKMYFNYKMQGQDTGKTGDKMMDNILIFEKREVEVTGDGADCYITEDGDEHAVADVTKVGSVDYVNIDGTYYYKGDGTPVDTVEGSNIETATTKTVITYENVDPEFHDVVDGDVVKKVTADETTIVYTKATFDSTVSYDSETTAKTVLSNTADINIDAKVEKDTKYTATGIYVPAFTVTVPIESSENDGWGGIRAEDAEEAYKIVNEDVQKNVFNSVISVNGKSYQLQGIEFKATPEYTGRDVLFSKDEYYEVDGTAVATYVLVSRGKVVTVTGTGTGDTNTKAKENVQINSSMQLPTVNANAALNAAIKKDNSFDSIWGQEKKDMSVSGVSYMLQGDLTVTETESYHIEGKYWDKISEEKVTDKEVTLARYSDSEKLEAQIIQNKNYKEGNILLDENNDTEFRNYLNKAKNLADKYNNLLKESIAADNAVKKAQDEVNALQDEIKKLKDAGIGYSTEILKLQAELEDAGKKLANAEEEKGELAQKLEDLKGKLDDAYEALQGKIDELTPPVSSGDETEDESGDETDDTTPTVVAPVTPAEEIVVPEGGAVVTPVATGAGVGTGQNLVNIGDEGTPLAAGIDNGNGNGDANGGDGEEVLVAGAEEDVEPAIVAIEDEETPLAAGSGADAKMSWWWLLIVALLGATGYKMYKDHQKKKEEAAQEA